MSREKSNLSKLLVLAVVIAAVLTVIISARPHDRFARIDGAFDVLAGFDGASDYTEQCAVCHGTDGRAQTTKGRKTHAADLTKSKVTDTKGIKIIANGEDSMPAFKDVLSKDRINDLMAYIHGFRKE